MCQTRFPAQSLLGVNKMNIQEALNGINQTVRNYAYETKQAGMSVVLKVKDFRNDPEFFQKVCQVAFASLQLIILRYPGAAPLTRFGIVLQTANMHDFYGFIKQPRHFFFPISADSIDENELLESLTDVLLFDPAELENFDEIDENQREELRGVIYNCLKAQLEEMKANNDAYRSVDEFKSVLQKRLRAIQNNNYDFAGVDLSHVKVTLHHTPLLERIMNLNWAVVDMGCVCLYLKGWNLLDTAKWADRIGQYPGFQWVKNQHLDRWVVGLVFTAFAWKLLEATRKLQDEALTREERIKARWNVVTSSAELILWGTTFLKLTEKIQINSSYLYCLAIFAKSLGLLSIALRPRHQFFQQPEVAPAA